MPLHPSIKILCLFTLAVAVQALHYPALLGLAVLLAAGLVVYRDKEFLRLLKRVRLLLLFLIVIYAFNTPGEYLSRWPFELAPTYEGLQTGLLMALRLCSMLAGLSLLLHTTSREQLIAGFFWLAYPLRYIKLSPERFAARLWLTLHYVEHAQTAQPKRGFFEHLDSLASADMQVPDGPERIQLASPGLSWLDGTALLGMLAVVVYLR